MIGSWVCTTAVQLRFGVKFEADLGHSVSKSPQAFRWNARLGVAHNGISKLLAHHRSKPAGHWELERKGLGPGKPTNIRRQLDGATN